MKRSSIRAASIGVLSMSDKRVTPSFEAASCERPREAGDFER